MGHLRNLGLAALAFAILTLSTAPSFAQSGNGGASGPAGLSLSGGTVTNANPLGTIFGLSDGTITGNWMVSAPTWTTGKELGLSVFANGANSLWVSNTAPSSFSSYCIRNQDNEEDGCWFHPNSSTANVTGTVTGGNLLTVTAVANGIMQVGQGVYFGGLYYGWISSLGTGTTGIGTYNLSANPSGNLGSSAIKAKVGGIFGGSTNIFAEADSPIAPFGIRTEYKASGALTFYNVFTVDGGTGRIHMLDNGNCHSTNRFGMQMDTSGYFGLCSAGASIGVGFENFASSAVFHRDVSGCSGTNESDCQLAEVVASNQANPPGYEWQRSGVRKVTLLMNSSPARWSFTDNDNSSAVPFEVFADATLRTANYGGEIHKARVVTAAGAITAATTDYLIEVNKTVGAASAVGLFATPTAGTILRVKDGKGDAAANNITITPAAGNIDNAGTYVINTNNGAVELQYDGTQWEVLSSR